MQKNVAIASIRSSDGGAASFQAVARSTALQDLAVAGEDRMPRHQSQLGR
ncbi:hypothetical protein [Paractinoplanes globisporus]|uniref:Uncharacterized protein n=1 Tax=Paractinoplanes globisporus TaxID=113565 RepID=A0ABW6WIC2_9ACTN|nr:hypothetical protein [Actinoplanes globisporus]